jgi:hypothetical protein
MALDEGRHARNTVFHIAPKGRRPELGVSPAITVWNLLGTHWGWVYRAHSWPDPGKSVVLILLTGTVLPPGMRTEPPAQSRDSRALSPSGGWLLVFGDPKLYDHQKPGKGSHLTEPDKKISRTEFCVPEFMFLQKRGGQADSQEGLVQLSDH